MAPRRVRLPRGTAHGEGGGKANGTACSARPDKSAQGDSPGVDELDRLKPQKNGGLRTEHDRRESKEPGAWFVISPPPPSHEGGRRNESTTVDTMDAKIFSSSQDEQYGGWNWVYWKWAYNVIVVGPYASRTDRLNIHSETAIDRPSIAWTNHVPVEINSRAHISGAGNSNLVLE